MSNFPRELPKLFGSITRREFLKGSGALLLSSGLAPLTTGSPFAYGMGTLDALSRETFALYRGDRFAVQNGSFGGAGLWLANVSAWERPAAPQTAGRGVPVCECFTVSFEGHAHAPLAQGTYLFEHSRLGRFPLFIVPGAIRGNAISYTATFNRIVA